MLKILVYSIVGLLLYFVSDWLLNQIEIRRGERFTNRSLIFFAIIFVLAVGLFNLVEYLELE